MLISIDTETTGLDLYHGAKPYLVTIYEDGQRSPYFYEWDVNPCTREPLVNREDVDSIWGIVQRADCIVGQNINFDILALQQIDKRFLQWDYGKTHDTLYLSHILASAMPHSLDALSVQYLGIDIEKYDNDLRDACMAARKIAKKFHPYSECIPDSWMIAEKGLSCMPSAKSASDKTDRGMESGSSWKYDAWLPRALANHSFSGCCSTKLYKGTHVDWNGKSFPLEHPWWTVLSKYANIDSFVTLKLSHKLLAEVRRRGYEKIYEQRRKLLRIVGTMRNGGITMSKPSLEETEVSCQRELVEMSAKCVSIAKKHFRYDLSLPKGNRNGNLMTFIFDVLKAPVLERSKKTAEPSFNEKARDGMLDFWEPGSPKHEFAKAFGERSKRITAAGYMKNYKRYWLPIKKSVGVFRTTEKDYYRIHPSINPCGSDTLRWSFSAPNSANTSKQEEFNLRHMFGPMSGREWWKFDAKNLELRFPAYEAGERAMLELFENPDNPPFYGSNHLLNFSIVYPDLWEDAVNKVGLDKAGPWIKEEYDATYYQWCKNGGFAVQYGAMEKDGGTGTADRAFHRAGSHGRLKTRFRAIHGTGGLNERCIAFARRHGYIETMPNKMIDPNHGYPLMVQRTSYGDISPTTPLNYRVQGSAMDWMASVMILVQEKLDTWKSDNGFDGFITIQQHDEIVCDFPKAANPVENPKRSNLWRAREIQRVMDYVGECMGVVTPGSCSYHEINWSKGVNL